jgi:hypothetical protein
MVRFRHRAAGLAMAAMIGGSVLSAPVAWAAPFPSPLPAHVFAPCFETWTSGSMSSIATQSGARYFTLAFLQTTGKSSCTLAWGGSKSQTVAGGRYLDDIGVLRGMGGDVIPSLGGWSADQGGTEIGDSCANVSAIATAYKELVTKYGVTRIDMDIEGRSLTNAVGIDRRNQAIKLLQDWAVINSPTLTVQYTLPTTRTGLPASSLAVLQNAVANGVRLDIVNLMAFDYYHGSTTSMGASAMSALTGLHGQLTSLLPPSTTDAQIWAVEGVSIMQGLDDYVRKTEMTTLQDARDILKFAQDNGMSTLSMWAIQRDNGGCPGRGGSGSCSGIVQDTWAFTTALRLFSGS